MSDLPNPHPDAHPVIASKIAAVQRHQAQTLRHLRERIEQAERTLTLHGEVGKCADDVLHWARVLGAENLKMTALKELPARFPD